MKLPRRLTDEEARPVMLAAGLEPLVPYPGGHTLWKSLCLICGNIVTPTYKDIKTGKSRGCRFCAKQRESPLRMPLEVAAKIALTASLKPLEPFPGASNPWLCLCLKCGKMIKPRITIIKKYGSRCGYCARNIVDIEDAINVMITARLKPLVDYPGSDIPWLCECLDCGSRVTPRFGSVKQGSRCKFCSKLKAGLSIRIAEHKAIEIMLSSGVQPIEAYPGSMLPWKSKCTTCDRITSPSYHNVKSGQSSCRYCAISYRGLSINDTALIYLIRSDCLSALKIGIGKEGSDRLINHKLNGWVPLKVWNEIAVDVARAAEARVLRNWRKAGIPVACTKEQMPQGGWTETVPLDMVDIAKVRRWVNYEIRKQKI